VIFLVTVRGSVVDDDDECTADQFPRLFHERNRISRRRQGVAIFKPGRSVAMVTVPPSPA